MLLLLRQAGLPEPQLEHRFYQGRKWRFDLAWPEQRLAVELDGGEWLKNGGRHNTDADREKLNTAAVLGWRVLRFSGQWLDRQPSECCRMVAEALTLAEAATRQRAVVDLAVQLTQATEPVLFYRSLGQLRQAVNALSEGIGAYEKGGGDA